MQIKEWLRKKIIGFLGMSKYEGMPGDDRLTFINDEDLIIKTKIRENNIWYGGDGDELLNFYTRQTTINYNYEPWYDRNKRTYFWSVASTEEDVKRTHSGQPRNIVDTLVAVIGKPDIQGGPEELGRDNIINKNIDKIITENDFWRTYSQLQMPLTLVEGWGCYKINWDKDISDYPIILYYKAEQVDFIYKSNHLIGIVFKDYYADEKGKRYLITETRRLRAVQLEDGKVRRDLCIEKEVFEIAGEDEAVKKVDFKNIPAFKNIEDNLVIEGFDQLLAQPTIFYEDTNTSAYGRSIYTGKLDLFDDLDQCLSQSANAVRKSTPVEYFNTDFLERNPKTGIAEMPKAYDRKYTGYKGGRTVDGNVNTNMPVQVTQPNLDFQQYSDQAISILLQIVNGIMSPATLGIDISKRDNAEAQREKEKITIFTRNMLVDTESTILKNLFSQALCAYECMTTGKITTTRYDMSINYSAFADNSFENKVSVLGDAYDKKNLSPKMYLTKLYGHSLSYSDFNAELEFLEKNQKKNDNPFADDMPPMMSGDEEDEETEQEPFK